MRLRELANNLGNGHLGSRPAAGAHPSSGPATRPRNATRRTIALGQTIAPCPHTGGADRPEQQGELRLQAIAQFGAPRPDLPTDNVRPVDERDAKRLIEIERDSPQSPPPLPPKKKVRQDSW